MNKRFLSILMAVIMILGAMPLAYASDIEGHREQTVVEMMAALSLIKGDGDGNFRPDDILTRAEYTTLILRLLGLEDLVGSYDANIPFEDVPSDHWAYSYISAAYELGIINGMSETIFGVNEKVKQIDAVKILVCALGYRIGAEKLGGYPGGYMAMGTRLKLYKGLGSDTLMTRAQACRLLYNSFSVKLADEENVTKNDEYVLDAYLDLYKVKGVIEETWHYQSGGISKDYIRVSGTQYYAPLADADTYFGEKVECYVKDVDGEKVIYFIKPVGSTDIISVNADDILPETTLSTFRYTDDENKDRKISLSSSLVVYKNGSKIPKESLSAADLIIGTGRVVLKSTQGSGYDIALVTEHRNLVINYLGDEKIYGKFGESLDIEEDDENIEFYKDDSVYAKELLKNGDVLSVAVSPDGERKMVYVSNDALIGSVSAIDTTDAGEPVYTVKDAEGNRNELKLAQSYLDAIRRGENDTVTMRIGENYLYHLYLDIYGNIADITALTVSEDGEYGYLLRSERAGSALSNGARFQILTMNNRFEPFEIPSGKKVKFGRNADGGYKISKEEPLFILEKTSAKQLVKYKLDKDGYIEEFYLADSSPSSDHFSNSGVEEKSYTYRNGLINQQLIVDRDTAIFAINVNAQYEDSMYAGNYTTTLKDGESSFMRFYDKDGNYVSAVVLSAKNLKRYTSPSDGYQYPVNYVNSPVFYISDIKHRTTEDGDTFMYIEGFQDGKAKSIAVANELEWYSEPLENLKEGIAIQYTSNSDIISRAKQADEIEQVIVFKTVFDFTAPIHEGATWEYGDLRNSRARISTFWGDVQSGSEEYCSVDVNGETFTAEIHSKTMQLEYLKDEKGFKLLTQPEINEGQRIFVRQRYMNTREVVIYER